MPARCGGWAACGESDWTLWGVGIGTQKAKVLATRALIDQWSLVCTLKYDEDQLNLNDVMKAAEIGGFAQGRWYVSQEVRALSRRDREIKLRYIVMSGQPEWRQAGQSKV
jgi:hypothetical protein